MYMIRYILILLGAMILMSTNPVSAKPVLLPGFTVDSYFQEQIKSYTFDTDVYILINAPPVNQYNPKKPIKLILYTLPNGNTIPQAIGKKPLPGDKYNIQHIGAQTRLLRKVIRNENIIVTYLAASSRSWPSWGGVHKENNGQLIQQIIDSVKSSLPKPPDELILSSHSGGGSFILNYMNSVDQIPDWIDRISFLDSIYNYSDEENHGDKLIAWLKQNPNHKLSVISYDDRNITWNGKLVLGPTAGTFRKTHKLLDRLQQEIPLTTSSTGNFIHWKGMNGQIDIIIDTNPKNEIVHSLLVEKNGFIYTVTFGTKYENKAGKFWGPPLYKKWVQKD